MQVYKYQKGWYVKTNFKDADGVNRQHCKRGFGTKKEAETYEADYKAALRLCPSVGAPSLTELLQSILSANNIAVPTATQEPVEEPKEPERTFQMVFDEYWAATIAKGIKAGTQETKRNMLEQHILPYFKDLELTAITAAVIKQWQEKVQQKERRGKKFTSTYLHSIQSQLNAVLNYAVRKKYLPFSPMVDLKNMGEKNAAPREIWTPDTYAAGRFCRRGRSGLCPLVGRKNQSLGQHRCACTGNRAVTGDYAFAGCSVERRTDSGLYRPCYGRRPPDSDPSGIR